MLHLLNLKPQLNLKRLKRVLKDVDEPIIARAFSFFWFKRIYLGVRFKRLSPKQQIAAVLHEMGHCELHHSEIRIVSLFLIAWWNPWWFLRICRNQELAADKYVVTHGYAHYLLDLLSGYDLGGWIHPSNRERRSAILSYTSTLA